MVGSGRPGLPLRSWVVLGSTLKETNALKIAETAPIIRSSTNKKS
jgi:hypothetical protein